MYLTECRAWFILEIVSVQYVYLFDICQDYRGQPYPVAFLGRKVLHFFRLLNTCVKQPLPLAF